MILISDKVSHSIFFSWWFVDLKRELLQLLKKKGFSQVFPASAVTELN